MSKYRMLSGILMLVILFSSMGVFAEKTADARKDAERSGASLGEISGKRDFRNGLKSDWQRAIPGDEEIIRIYVLQDMIKDYRKEFIRYFKIQFEIFYKQAYLNSEDDKGGDQEEYKGDIISGLGASLGMIYGEIAGFKDFESGIPSNWSRSILRDVEINKIFDLRSIPRGDRRSFLGRFRQKFQLGYKKAYYNAHFGSKKDNMGTGRKDGEVFGSAVGNIFGTKDYHENRNSDYNRNMPTERELINEYSLNKDNRDYLEGFINGFTNSYENNYLKGFREAKNNITLLEDSSAYNNGNNVGESMGKIQASMDHMEKKSNDWKRSQALSSSIIMEYNLIYQTIKYRDGFINGYLDGYAKGYTDRYKELGQIGAMSKTISEAIPINGANIVSRDAGFKVDIDKGIYYKPVILTMDILNDISNISDRYIQASNLYRLSMTNPSGAFNNDKKIRISFEYHGDKDGGIYRLEGNKWNYLTSTIKDGAIVAYINPNNIDSYGNIFAVLVDRETEIFHDIRGHWARDEITAYIRRGVVNGYPDKTFKPDQHITRAEFLVLLSKLYEWYMPSDTGNVKFFKDHETFKYSEKYISYGLLNKYIIGYPDKYFRPYNNISYKEVNIIMKKVLNDSSFKWKNYSIQMMHDKKVRSSSYDSIHNNITRGEFSYMLYKLNEWKY